MADQGEIHQMGGMSMMQKGGLWSRGGEDMFWQSSRDDNDEEKLLWASLEKLPTFNRLQKGILLSPEGHPTEVDINKLGTHEEKALLDRLLHVAEEGHERFLRKLRERIDRVGINLPSIEVRFENLNIEAKVYVGSRGLPTLINSTANTIESFANALHIIPSRKRPLPILHNVSGIIKPRRMTLLLGPPGSGKTTLLLALAGKLDSDLKVSGKVTYNGHEMNEFVPEKTAAYISQHDLQLWEMTVRETLEFSARCQGVGTRYETITELARRENEAHIQPDPDIDLFFKALSIGGNKTRVVTDYIIKLLGLEVCADTMIGNDLIRGISGGQRKRVTTGEMLVGPSRVLFMDEISTGLDSSTTYQIVNTLRTSIHILQGTAVISLLQPAPETYDLFDDVILISDGHIVYQGPREHVQEFFESMGFKCPERKGVADFLQEVTSSKDQGQYWARNGEAYQYVPVKAFSEAFNSFHTGQNIANELSVPFDKSTSHPAALITSKYGVSKKELLMANIEREILLMKRNSIIYIFKSCQLIIMAFMTSTVFLRTNMHRDSVANGGLYLGALFFSVGLIMFHAYSELAITITNLPVFFKQRDILLYPAWTYTLPSWILKIPVSIVEVGVWVFTIYYVIGFDPNVERLFKQYLLLLAVSQMSSGLYRLIGGLARDMIVANTVGSFALLIMFVLGGFILSRDNIKKWWIWGYWISPLTYAQNGISPNEFLAHSWDKVLQGSNKTLGIQVLESRGFFTEAKWYWIGVGALTGFVFLFNALYMLALTYLKPFRKPPPQISEEILKEKYTNLTGEIAEGSPRGQSNSTSQRGDAFRHSASSSVQDLTNLGQSKKDLVLPFEALALTFDNVRYSVDMPTEMKAQGVQEDRLVLLKGISSSFRPGVLTALMGVSGAGKTTLMDVLAGRKTGGYVEGSIMVSGYPKRQETFARISGYCEQNDIHSPHLTVYESLVFSAWLRLSSDIDLETRERFVKEIMELVELNFLRDLLVGLPGVNGLSTEQRKRLTIAVELVANPSIIFMDEPTSGLDARAAAIVMRAVRNTVDTGRTVVCTIHQPSIDIFEAFDELLLMKRGGEEIYVGPLGPHSSQIVQYFESIEAVHKIKDGYNPATWMLEVTTSAQEEAIGVNFSEVYKNSELYRRNKALIKELSTPTPDSSDLHFKTKYSQPLFIQCLACLWKQRLSYWRNPSYTAVRFFFTTAIAVVFGTIFWDLGSRIGRRQDLFNAMGSMYASVIFIGVQNAQSVQPVVSIERTVFYREKSAGMYSALPYAFGQVAIEIPYIFIQAMVFGIIVYAMIGYEWTAVKFFWFIFFMYFTLLYYTFYGMMAVGLTPNYVVSTVFASSFYNVWNLFAGFLIPQPQIPIWWRWYVYICPVAWTLYGLVSSQFGDVQSTIEGGQTVADFLTSYFGFHHDFLGVVAIIVAGFAVLFAFLFGFAVQKFNFQKR